MHMTCAQLKLKRPYYAQKEIQYTGNNVTVGHVEVVK